MTLLDLEQIAKRATPGPWDYYFATGEGHAIVTYAEDKNGYRSLTGCVLPLWIRKEVDVHNAEYIAAFNPATALKLIEALRVARESLDDIETMGWEEMPNAKSAASTALAKIEELCGEK